MTRDPDERDQRDDVRDDLLDEQVRAHLSANVPGHRAGFWEDLEGSLAQTPQESSDPVQGTVLEFRPSPRKATTGSSPEGPIADGGHAMTRPDTRPAPDAVPTGTDLGGGDRWGAHPPAETGRRGGWWAAAAAAAVVLATATGVGLALRGGPAEPSVPAASSQAPSPQPSSSAEPTVTASGAPTEGSSSPATPDPSGTVGTTYRVSAMSTSRAVDLVTGTRPDGGVQGVPKEAWTWRDGRYVHVLLATLTQHQSTETVDGTPMTRTDGATTRIYYAYGDSLDSLTLARTMTDPNGGICEVEFGADMTTGSVTAFDADGDGVSEVTVGWEWICRGDPGPSEVRLAMLKGKDKYILRGTGVLFGSDPGDNLDPPPAQFTPEPAASQWPGRSYSMVTDLFRSLWK
ncbi:MAG: hypothetical protein U0Q15_09530 [Kineosporiaceae bacterium]